jgi:hypothetical protein
LGDTFRGRQLHSNLSAFMNKGLSYFPDPIPELNAGVGQSRDAAEK